MGMTLLQKMGWKPGEGLGKNKEGSLEPLKLEVKMDKKGLLSHDELHPMQVVPLQPAPRVATAMRNLSGKHPVSLISEYCSKRAWSPPKFEICFENGPDHKKNFMFKVVVNGVEYKPVVASSNKKTAKAEAALVSLRALGLVPP